MSTAQPQTASSAGLHSAEAQPICVPPDKVGQVWPHVSRMVQRAFDKTDYGTFGEVAEALFDGRARLWVVWREPEIIAAVVTQIRPTTYSKVCYLCAAGGESREEWTHMMANIEEYARDMGCNKIRATGRKGWTRILPGFREKLIVFEKDIA